MKINFSILILIVATVASLIALAVMTLRHTNIEEPDEIPAREVAVTTLSEGGDVAMFVYEDGSTAFMVTIEQWREWAREHLSDILEEPILIGDQEMTPDRFTHFNAISLSPSGDSAVFSVSAYAMLTTVSLVGNIDIDTRDITLVEEPAWGEVDEFLWSSRGEYAAYALGTARARGDYLHIDSMILMERTAALSEVDIIEALREEDPDYETGSDQPDDREILIPHFRDLSWEDGEYLLFTTNKYIDDDEESVRWRFSISEAELTMISDPE